MYAGGIPSYNQDPVGRQPGSALLVDLPIAKTQGSLINAKGSRTSSIKPRTKRWAPKVRTGCLTCRWVYLAALPILPGLWLVTCLTLRYDSMRRVKCDELKPDCRVCLTGGRTCGGYAREVQKPPISLLTSQPCHPVSPPGMEPSESERNMFDLLCKTTVKHVSSVFDQSFWSLNMLRATQVYPAVWHACLAFAAVHMIYTAPQHNTTLVKTQNLHTFALRQYNSSIRYIIRLNPEIIPTQEEQEMVLLVCMLFAGLSCLQSDICQSIVHSSNGIALFYRWKYWDQDTRPYRRHNCFLPGSSVAALITQFDAQFRNRARVDFPLKGINLHSAHTQTDSTLEAFTSAEEAFSDLQPLLTGMIEIMQHSGHCSNARRTLPPRDERYFYHQRFVAWRTKFDRLLLQSQKPQLSDSGTILLLECLSMAMGICLRVNFDASETAFDDFRSIFEQIVTLMEQLFKEESRIPAGTTSRFCGLSFSLSICGLLSLVAINCRDGKVRRTAIALLRQFPQRGSTYNSEISVQICEAIMKVEEDGHCRNGSEKCKCVSGTFICCDHRVSLWTLELHGYKDASLLMRTVRDVREHCRGQAVKVFVPSQ